MLNWALRYAPIIAWVKDADEDFVLEVGSGSRGVSHYWSESTTVGLDLKFETAPVSSMRAVQGSTYQLPFRDGAFAVVVASDVLEHLDATQRPDAVRELQRVCRRKLLLGYPRGWRSERLDRKLADHLLRRHIPVPQWLLEHFQNPYPEASDIEMSLHPQSRITEISGNTNRLLHRIVVAGEFTRLNRLLMHLDSPILIRRLRFLIDLPPTYREMIVVDIGHDDENRSNTEAPTPPP